MFCSFGVRFVFGKLGTGKLHNICFGYRIFPRIIGETEAILFIVDSFLDILKETWGPIVAS